MFDTDNDGTIDLAEAKKAASGIVSTSWNVIMMARSTNESWARRLTPKELAAADPDHDGTLTKGRIPCGGRATLQCRRSDHDGTLDAKELNTKAGQALLRLLK